MADTSGTRREKRAAQRVERQERERREAARARQKQRLFVLGGVAALAAVIIAVIVIATGSGDDGSPTKQAGESVAGANDTAALLAGIEQDGPVLGDPRAPVTLIEFGDLQCPYCKDASDDVLPAIIEDYVRTGRVKVIFRDVAFLGDDSIRAAQMAAAAGQQNRLWDFVKLFYLNQGQENSGYVTDEFLREIGGGVRGLDVDRAMDSRGDPELQRQIAEAQQEWQGYGLTGTPSFVVGRTGGELEEVNLEQGITVEGLTSAIDRALASAES